MKIALLHIYLLANIEKTFKSVNQTQCLSKKILINKLKNFENFGRYFAVLLESFFIVLIFFITKDDLKIISETLLQTIPSQKNSSFERIFHKFL